MIASIIGGPRPRARAPAPHPRSGELRDPGGSEVVVVVVVEVVVVVVVKVEVVVGGLTSAGSYFHRAGFPLDESQKRCSRECLGQHRKGNPGIGNLYYVINVG